MEENEVQLLRKLLLERDAELRSKDAENAHLKAALSAARSKPCGQPAAEEQFLKQSAPPCRLPPDAICLPEDSDHLGASKLRTVTLDSLKAGADEHNLMVSLGVLTAADQALETPEQTEYLGYQSSITWISNELLRIFAMPDLETGLKRMNQGDVNLAIRLVVQGWRKTFMLSEQPQPVMHRMVIYHDNAPSVLMCMWRLPVKYLDQTTGSVSPAWLSFMCSQQSSDRLYEGYMREHMMLKYTPSMVTLCGQDGRIWTQNATSLGSIGFQGIDHRLAGSVDPTFDIDYIKELLNHDEQLYEEILEVTRTARSSTQIVHVRSPLLKKWLGAEGRDVWHEVQVTAMKDPVTKKPAFLVSQTDVSNQVHAQQALDKLKRQQEKLLNGILPAQVVAKLLRTAVDSDSDDEDYAAQDEPYDREAAHSELFDRSSFASPDQRNDSTSAPYDLGKRVVKGYTAAEPSAADAQIIPDAIAADAITASSSSHVVPSDDSTHQPSDCFTSGPPKTAFSSFHMPHGLLTQTMMQERGSQASSHSSTHSMQSSPRRSGPLLDPSMTTKMPQPSSSPAEQDQNVTHMAYNGQSRTSQLRKMHTSSRASGVELGVADHFGSGRPAAHFNSFNVTHGSQASSVDLSPRHFTPVEDSEKVKAAVEAPQQLQHITLGMSVTAPTFPEPAGAAASFEGNTEVTLDHLVDRSTSVRQTADFNDLQQKLQLHLDPDWADVYDDDARTESESGMYLSQQDVMSLSTFHEAATILFADIKGFTSMCAQLHPAQVMLFLNSLYNVFDSLCEVHDVYKVETIGDCYMVAGGLFGPSLPENSDACRRLGGVDPDHAQKVVNMAKAMVAAASRLQTPLGQPVEIRVGIHSGSVCSGVVGRRCPRFCLFGASVNCASRMESTGKPGCIHVSQDTCDLTPHEEWEPTNGGVFAKGYGQVQTFILGGTGMPGVPAGTF